ncbi:site-specific integrase [Saccharopolyspora sp. NPDC050389]|uniref:site-specific integrase n=1 Tax=Saccharopolyspora sp. NPDC050389 TaxID=3155516 RepID=UPI00340AA294
MSSDPVLQNYHLLPSVRGDLLVRLGRGEEAKLEFERAAELTQNIAERAFLLRRAEELADSGVSGPALGAAAEEFLARDELNAATIRSYGQTLRRLRLAVGDQLPLAALTAEQVARVFETAWGAAAAKTWNRHRSAIRSFCAWACLDDLAADLDRRAETRSRALPIGSAQLYEIWNRPGIPLRERALWRLLHESGAAVKAVLSLNVEDLDLDDRRARAAGTWVSWRSGTAGLLPELVAGRSRGPLFLTDRKPGPSRTPRDGDRCPETCRSRLSYERAEYLFKRATAALDPTGDGYTLRQLKPLA